MNVSLLLDPHPPEPARMPREQVAASQRARLLRAMAEAVAEKGYAHTVVADVVARARVSRKTFYEHFDSMEACFLATFDECVAVVRAALEQPLDPSLPVAEQGRRMIESYLGLLAAEPRIAKTNLVEVYAVGPRAAERRRAALAGFAELLKLLHARLREEGRGGRELGDLDYELIVGGVSAAVTIRVATGDAASLPALAPALTDYVLRALGAEEA
ncbi:MAG TPA: TetR/AcrR family transcriptional regulator [Solirubrobacteraceae bacterium]|jgi:AcrR family transcriptional regulator